MRQWWRHNADGITRANLPAGKHHTHRTCLANKLAAAVVSRQRSHQTRWKRSIGLQGLRTPVISTTASGARMPQSQQFRAARAGS
ncbi:MAG: hypothetical protein Q8S56_09130, partial [Polaromonas sp.]|nr:hypothetical protein [Polaromonas sp.]